MTLRKIIQRFLFPPFVVTIIYWFKFRSFVSPRAEVELSPMLTIGKGTRISSFCKIKATQGPLNIGSDVSIGTNCFIAAEEGGIKIGDYTLIGPNVTIVGDNYSYERLDVPICKQKKTSKGITIESDVWIGANTAILDGVRIGKGCIIGSGAIVRENLPDYTVAVPHQRLVMLPRQSIEETS